MSEFHSTQSNENAKVEELVQEVSEVAVSSSSQRNSRRVPRVDIALGHYVRNDDLGRRKRIPRHYFQKILHISIHHKR